MIQTCEQCGTNYDLSEEDITLYRKFGVEIQKLCFDCDQKQRLCFRNGRALYKRKCDATGEDIISMYSPDKPYKVYKSDYWYSDKWDATDFGQDFDFSRSFFEQFQELKLKVPRLALSNINALNSDFCNSSYGNKNCYLIFGGDNNEDSMYGVLCMNNTKSLDLDYSNQNQYSYMLGDSINCYECQFVFNSKNCNNCYFISDCIGCNECILSTNLNNKSYYINNKPYSKDEYFEKKKQLLNGSYTNQQNLLDLFKEILKNRTVKFTHSISCENSTGDYLKNSKNCEMAFDISDCEDLTNVIFGIKSKDGLNVSMLGEKSELLYNTLSPLGSYNCRYSSFIINSSNIQYSDFTINCKDLFGCVGLRQKQYCILNKQYTKEEYETLLPKVIEHMKKLGEYEKFFPKKDSCFCYNETSAHDHFPLTKEEALKQGFTWKEIDPKEYLPQNYSIPDNISDTPDTIVNEVLGCVNCGKNYKINNIELKFYKSLNTPIPRQCPDCRYRFRDSFRNPKKLWQRNCQKCNKTIESSYSLDRTEKVYCEACYLAKVY